MAKMKITPAGYGMFKLAFPESEEYACDGVRITESQLRDLYLCIHSILFEGDDGAWFTGGWVGDLG